MRLPAAILFFALCCTAVAAQTAPPSAETPARWSETAFGISLEPPPESTVLEQPTDGTVAAFVHPSGYQIAFDLAHSEQSMADGITTAAVAAQVQVKFARARTESILFKQQRLADRPGALAYYLVRDDDGTTWLLGQALIMLEPQTVAVLTLTNPRDVGGLTPEELEQLPSRRAFERAVESVHVPDIFELKGLVESRVAAGEAWRGSLTAEALRDALPADRWYRLMEGDTDVGYAHLRSTHDPAELRRAGLTPPGTVVQMDMRHVIRGTAVDTQQRVYASAVGSDEMWSTKTTLRTGQAAGDPGGKRLPGAAAEPRREPTWVETGVRGGGRLMVTIETPPADETVRTVQQHERFRSDKPKNANGELAGRVDDLAWSDPPVAYLTQVDLFALARLFPVDAPTMSFYAYNPSTASLSLRTVRAARTADGGKAVYDRPTARRAETVTRFDAEGNLVEQQLPGGLRLVPTTPQELREAWNIE